MVQDTEVHPILTGRRIKETHLVVLGITGILSLLMMIIPIVLFMMKKYPYEDYTKKTRKLPKDMVYISDVMPRDFTDEEKALRDNILNPTN